MSRRKKIPLEILQATTHALSNDGRGIASVNGKVTFIEGALAGEKVDFQYTAIKRNYDEARVISVIEASSHRVQAECPHFDLCGGCSLQHLSSAQQLQSKQELFLETLKRIGGIVPEKILTPIQAATFSYRSKARLSVRYVEKKSALLIGFRERRSSYVVNMDSCAVLDARVGKKLLLLRELVNQLSIKCDIPQIEVATSQDIVCLMFRVIKTPSVKDIEILKAFGVKHHFRLLLQPAGPDSLCDLDFQSVSSERLVYRVDDDKIEIKFHPLDFTQVNVAVNRSMNKQAMALLDPQPEEHILDLFCGLGNFSLPLALRAKNVVGVEGEERMVKRAYENATHNGINNIEFHAANLFAEASYQAPWANKKYQKILIDPPRSGAIEAMPFVGKIKPQAILYVSCDPATLARDAGVLVKEFGYTAKTVGIMDMFPHTAHIESMILFSKN